MKDFKKILAAYKFTDEHGHPLETCQDFLDLVDAYEEEVLTKRGVEVVQKILRDKEPVFHAVVTPQTPGAPLAMFLHAEWAETWRASNLETGLVASFKVRLNAQPVTA
jgi:hypothetical protein